MPEQILNFLALLMSELSLYNATYFVFHVKKSTLGEIEMIFTPSIIKIMSYNNNEHKKLHVPIRFFFTRLFNIFL